MGSWCISVIYRNEVSSNELAILRGGLDTEKYNLRSFDGKFYMTRWIDDWPSDLWEHLPDGLSLDDEFRHFVLRLIGKELDLWRLEVTKVVMGECVRR